MRTSFFAIVLCVLQLAVASKVVHERRTVSPTSKFTLERRAPADRTITLRVYLKQNNLHRLDDFLYEVSDPASKSYGKHWSPEEVKSTFMPSAEAHESVVTWLHSEIDDPRIVMAPSGSHLTVPLSVAEAERLLDTKYNIFTHADGSQHVACDHYSLPSHVREHVDFLTPGVALVPRTRISKRASSSKSAEITRPPKFMPLSSQASFPTSKNLSACDEMITPDCLRALYNINYEPKHTDKNTFAIAEFTPQSYVTADLQMFFEQFSPKSVGQLPKLLSIDGGDLTANNATSFDINGESDLDFEFGMTLTAPQPVVLYQVGDDVEGGSFTNMLEALDKSYCGHDNPNFDGIYPDPAPGGFKGPQSCGIAKAANVISVSYGGDEVEVPPSYQERECAEYGKLGLLGTTILFASGDDGVAGSFGECTLPDNQTVNGDPEGPGGIRFVPSWPLTCPFVTAVGATQVNPNATVNDPESASAQVIFSGGGFSDIYPLPAYQHDAVKSFFKNHNPPYSAAQYNNSMRTRGYPDISANGVNYVIAIDGEFGLVFGTSASTPVVASMITLINDKRIGLGKGPVGFINPALYSASLAGAFHDITSGNNPGCNTTGFEAVPGWDPVTGLGTPNFPKMLDAFVALP